MDSFGHKNIDIYLKSPTDFMDNNYSQLLPDWQISPKTMIIVFLKAKFSLEKESIAIEREKDQLLEQFLSLGESFYLACHQHNLLAEIISPQDGYPIHSNKGKLTFDLVAIIHESLKFNFYPTIKGCKVLQHPLWNTAVYPGLFLSTASADTLTEIITFSQDVP